MTKPPSDYLQSPKQVVVGNMHDSCTDLREGGGCALAQGCTQHEPGLSPLRLIETEPQNRKFAMIEKSFARYLNLTSS